MSLQDFVIKDFETLPSDATVSKAMSILSKGAKAILIGGNAAVTHKTILRARGSPDQTKIKSLLMHFPVLSIDASYEDAVKAMLVNGVDALPVQSGGKVTGIVTERALLKNLASESSITAKDVMTSDPVCVKENDEAATAKTLMLDHNVSRLPVLDSKGRLCGIIEDTDLMKMFVPEEKLGRGDRSGRQKSQKIAPVRDLMNSIYYKITTKTPVSEIAQNLQKYSAGIVLEDETPVGIVTAKDILETVPVPEEGVYVQITGLHEEDDFTKAEVNREIDSVVKKMAAVVNIQFVWIHEKHVHDVGGKTKYSIRVRASTDWGLFVSKYWGYDIMDAVSNAMKEVEKEVVKHKEKGITKKKGRGVAPHGRKD